MNSTGIDNESLVMGGAIAFYNPPHAYKLLCNINCAIFTFIRDSAYTHNFLEATFWPEQQLKSLNI